jgi:tetratricopeptide (TPR) repeat protein
MFFPRLRRQAKWVFVLLAVIFAGGFILFGIGSEGGTGIGDIFRDAGGGTDAPSVGEARERVEENPRDAEAKLELARALEAEGETAEAIRVLTDYTELRPRDDSALRQLAGLYLTQAQEAQRRAQNAQALAQYRAPSGFSEPLKLNDTESVGQNPITEAVSAEANTVITAAYTEAQKAFTQAVDVYRRVVAVSPRDPNAQLELAQTAQQAGDVATAIAAYERFVELAPDDPSTPLVKQQIAQLKDQRGGIGSG